MNIIKGAKCLINNQRKTLGTTVQTASFYIPPLTDILSQMSPVNVFVLHFCIVYGFFIFSSECVSSKWCLFFGYFFPKFIYVPLTYILDASSQITPKFYLCFLSLLGDSLTIQLLYRSIQFCRHFLSFTFRYFSCTIYFKHTHSHLLPQCEIQTSNSYKKLLIVQ